MTKIPEPPDYGYFTAHNIRLPDGTETLPGARLTAETGICQAALRDLALAFPHTTPWGRGMITVADLGCLEGGHAAEFARHGYAVTGVEARDENLACCALVCEALGLPNLKFCVADARDLPGLGYTFDAVFCAGLLYHLENPGEFIRMLGQQTRRVVIIHTLLSGSPTQVHEGNLGHWVDVPGLGSGQREARWWGLGDRVFWMTKLSLVGALRAAGFPLVFEQHDWLPADGSSYADEIRELAPRDSAAMLVGIKP